MYLLVDLDPELQVTASLPVRLQRLAVDVELERPEEGGGHLVRKEHLEPGDVHFGEVLDKFSEIELAEDLPLG